jgi:hypothetical protein
MARDTERAGALVLNCLDTGFRFDRLIRLAKALLGKIYTWQSSYCHERRIKWKIPVN